jgi:hypothetical protein
VRARRGDLGYFERGVVAQSQTLELPGPVELVHRLERRGEWDGPILFCPLLGMLLGIAFLKGECVFYWNM